MVDCLPLISRLFILSRKVNNATIKQLLKEISKPVSKSQKAITLLWVFFHKAIYHNIQEFQQHQILHMLIGLIIFKHSKQILLLSL